MFGPLAPKAGSPQIVNTNNNPLAGYLPYSNGDGTYSWNALQMMPSLGNQPKLFGGYVVASNSATALTNFGRTSAGSTQGTGSNAVDSTGSFINYLTAGTTGSTAGQSPGAWTEYRYSPRMVACLKFPSSGDLVNIRFYCGLWSSTGPNSDAANNTACASFRYSTAADGGFFQTMTQVGSSNLRTLKSTGVAVTAGTIYYMAIDASNSNFINFYINGTLVNTHNTNLPTGSTTMGSSVITITTENVAKNIKIGAIYFETA